MRRLLCLFAFSGFLTYCATSSVVDCREDFVIARTALERAKQASADKFFPKQYFQAKVLYKKGADLFKKGKYREAKNRFQTSIQLLEKLELYSLYKKQKEKEYE